MSRKTAREYAYKLIFEFIFTKDIENTETIKTIFKDPELTESDENYINNVYSGVKNHYEELTSIIAKNAKNFKFDRIFKPDLAALLLSTYEMLYMKDIPAGASISEAVELVKKYATEKSYMFVNGVLAAIYKEIHEC